jgi:serine/threonine-protein kinase
VIAGIVLVAIFAFIIAGRHFISAPTKTTESTISVPTDGKYLAVFPFSVQGDVKPLAENLSNELSKKFLALPGMSGIVSTAATEAVAAEGLLDMRVHSVETAGKLGVNRVVHGTVKGTPQKFRITVIAEDVATHAQFRKEFWGSPENLNVLVDKIYTWSVQVLNLALANGPPQPVSDYGTEDLQTFDLYLKSYTVVPVEQRSVNAKIALQFYEEAVKHNPRSALRYAGLARAKLALYQTNRDASSLAQDSQIAAQYAERLEGEHELPAQAHGALGEVYRETGKTEEAYKHFRQGLMLSPNDDLWKQLGRAYEMDGKETQAIIALENAVTMNPHSDGDYNALGNAYFHFARYDMARIAYRHAVEINPNSANAQMNLGNACFEQARYDEAIVEYEKTLRLGPNASVYANLGVAYLFLKRNTDAVKMLEQAVKMKTDDEEKVGNLGDAYRASGSKRKATQAYARAIALAKKDLEANPTSTQSLGDLALYYAKTGEDALADQYIHEARSIDAASPDLLYNEAIIRGMAKQPTAALESLHLALERGFSVQKAKLDPDLEPLRVSPEFAKVFAGLGKQN